MADTAPAVADEGAPPGPQQDVGGLEPAEPTKKKPKRKFTIGKTKLELKIADDRDKKCDKRCLECRTTSVVGNAARSCPVEGCSGQLVAVSKFDDHLDGSKMQQDRIKRYQDWRRQMVMEGKTVSPLMPRSKDTLQGHLDCFIERNGGQNQVEVGYHMTIITKHTTPTGEMHFHQEVMTSHPLFTEHMDKPQLRFSVSGSHTPTTQNTVVAQTLMR